MDDGQIQLERRFGSNEIYFGKMKNKQRNGVGHYVDAEISYDGGWNEGCREGCY